MRYTVIRAAKAKGLYSLGLLAGNLALGVSANFSPVYVWMKSRHNYLHISWNLAPVLLNYLLFYQFPLLFSVFTSKTLFGSEKDSKLIKQLEIFSNFHRLLEEISLYWLCRVVRDDYAQLFQLCNVIHVGSLKATVRVFTPKRLGNATYQYFPPRDRESVLNVYQCTTDGRWQLEGIRYVNHQNLQSNWGHWFKDMSGQ